MSGGALANLGHNIARNTVKRILHDHGIAPAPARNQRTPWKTFLQAYWEGLAAADLFTVEVLTLAGLRRYFVFFVIALKTRRVHIAGIHPQPDGRWMEQMARNLTDPVDGFLRTARQLIHDRDPLYTRVFGEILTSGDVGPIRLPPKSPNLNAYAERFVRSIKEECLHRVVPLGEGHLRLIVHEYVEHYQRERNHQGLDNQLLQRPPPPVRADADVQRRERLGGLLSFYYRARIDEVLDQVGLGKVAHRKVKKLSGGMVRRLGVAQALVHEPQVLVVDEPTVGLDPEERIRFRQLMTQLGRERTILLSTHIVADLGAGCREIALLDSGRTVFQGSPSELIRRALGRVFEVTVAPAEAEAIEGRYEIVSTSVSSDNVTLRGVTAGEQLPASATAVAEPNLEESYLAFMATRGRTSAARQDSGDTAAETAKGGKAT